jgi:hypothetical protein
VVHVPCAIADEINVLGQTPQADVEEGVWLAFLRHFLYA